MSTDRAQSFRCHLPPELWGEVLRHIGDPYDLWVNCRQVSSLFKHEAEHAFRSRYLPLMVINCLRVDEERDAGEPPVWKGMCLVELELDANYTTLYPNVARFDLRTTSMQSNPGRRNDSSEPEWLNFKSEGHRAQIIHRCLDRNDANALKRKEEFDPHNEGFHTGKVSFAVPTLTDLDGSLYYSNDIELPAMTIEFDAFSRCEVTPEAPKVQKQGHVTLDWESLVSTFFAEYIFVRRRLLQQDQTLTPQVSLHALFADAMTLVGKRCPSLNLTKCEPRICEQDKKECESVWRDFIEAAVAARGSHNTELYEAAYDARLRKAFAQKGLEEEIGTDEYMLHITTHISLLQAFRDRGVRKLADKYWRLEFGEVVIEDGSANDGNEDNESGTDENADDSDEEEDEDENYSDWGEDENVSDGGGTDSDRADGDDGGGHI